VGFRGNGDHVCLPWVVCGDFIHIDVTTIGCASLVLSPAQIHQRLAGDYAQHGWEIVNVETVEPDVAIHGFETRVWIRRIPPEST
jgi:hypothetical protein